MIPIRLIIKGIYSYQQEQTIDFNELTAANLFGIFGQVGSGKSTILEAISFVLYGETERLNQKDNRNYNMMNLKSDELFIDFIFKNGKDGNTYRFKVSGKRNKNNFEKISSFNRNAYKKVDDHWQPIETNSVENIIGLSYRNFKRTIIIPQGKFQEFLHLGNKDRTQMLKELFNLDKYELFYQVSSIEKKNKEKQQNIEGQLLQIGETSSQIIKVEKSKLEEINSCLNKLDKSFLKKEKAELEMQKLKELFEEANAHKEHIDKLDGEKEFYQKLESKISDYEYCLVNFKDLLARKQEFSKKVEEIENELESNRIQYATIESTLDSEEEAFKQIKDEYKNRENLNKETSELNKIARIQSLKKQMKDLQKKIDGNTEKQKNFDLSIKELKVKYKTTNTIIAEKKKKIPNTNVLLAIKEWFTVNKSIRESIFKLEKTKKGILEELQLLESNKNTIISKGLRELLKYDPKAKSIKEIVSDLEHYKNEIDSQIIKIESEIEKLAVQEKLETFAENLTEGKPCPLCGSAEHPAILDIKHVNQHLMITRKSKSKLNNKLSVINEILKNLEGFATQLDSQKDFLNDNQKELDSENERQKDHIDKFIWTDYNIENEASVNESIELANKLKNEIEDLEKKSTHIHDNLESQIENKDKTKEYLNNFKKQNAQIASEKQTLCGQLELLEIDTYKNTPAQELEDMVLNLKDKVVKIENQYTELEKRLVELRTKRDTLRGTISSGEKTLIDYQHSLDKTESNFKIGILKSKFKKTEDIEIILQEELDIGKEKERVTKFKQELYITEEKYKALVEKIKDKKYDHEQHSMLNEDIAKLKTQIAEKKEELGRQKAIIQNLAEALEKRNKLEKELDYLKLRGEDINTLKQLFKGSGFVNYVSTVYLQNLCNAANERFYQLTRKQLRLEINKDNIFQIRDFLNEGKVRNIKTLSGGQMFQAALSLALSLSESIQKFNESKQNFFFIDEGFGSLDKDALQIVFDTLKSLQKENRIVGIISHVEDLQQEVDTYLKIINDQEKGSTIKTSWSDIIN